MKKIKNKCKENVKYEKESKIYKKYVVKIVGIIA